jgi:hypothetical protein
MKKQRFVKQKFNKMKMRYFGTAGTSVIIKLSSYNEETGKRINAVLGILKLTKKHYNPNISM